MKKNKKGFLATALAGILGGASALPSMKNPDQKSDKPQYPFTMSERRTLRGLSGKEKKQYIKELKVKYQGQHRDTV